jgi:hypothetical protein
MKKPRQMAGQQMQAGPQPIPAPSDEACPLDAATDPTAEAEGGTGSQQGQGAGDGGNVSSLSKCVLKERKLAAWNNRPHIFYRDRPRVGEGDWTNLRTID